MDIKIPTRYHFEKAEIDGVDEEIQALVQEFHVFENINKGCYEGYMIIADGENAGLIDKYQLEFNEEFTFSFRNALDEVYEINAVMNGLEDEYSDLNKKTYRVSFISLSGRENFKVKKVWGCYNEETPQKIAEDMSEKLGVETIDVGNDQGQPLTMMTGGRTPLDVMKYVCSHGISGNPSVRVEEGEQDGESKGNTGFLFWETIDGHRFSSMDDLLDNNPYETHEDYQLKIAQTGGSLEEQVKSILHTDFPAIGDIQSKLESGAFSSKMLSFDIDTGEYKEIKFLQDESLTEKMKEIIGEEPSRVFNMFFENEFKNTNEQCEKSEENAYDQSRRTTQQHASRQHTFQDQHGRFEIPARYVLRAGDTVEVKLGKMSGKNISEYDKKHSGKYLIKQVGHHMYINGAGYTKISTIRTTTQQDDKTS